MPTDWRASPRQQTILAASFYYVVRVLGACYVGFLAVLEDGSSFLGGAEGDRSDIWQGGLLLCLLAVDARINIDITGLNKRHESGRMGGREGWRILGNSESEGYY